MLLITIFTDCYDSEANTIFYPERYISANTDPDTLYTGCVESVSQCVEKCAEETVGSCRTVQLINSSQIVEDDNTTSLFLLV